MYLDKVGEEDDPDGGAVPHVLNDGLHGLAVELVNEDPGVLHLPGDLPNLGAGVLGPDPNLGGLGTRSGLSQLLVLKLL